MLRIKRIAAGAATLLLAGTLAACSSAEDPATGEAGALSAIFDGETEAVKAQLQELYQAALDAGETEINIYTITHADFAEPSELGEGQLVALFQEAFPEITPNGLAGSDIYTSLESEKASGNYLGDVIEHGDTEVSTLKEQDYFSSFTPAGAESLSDEKFADAEGYAFTAYHRLSGITYNTSLVSADEVPTSFEELADPKWQGQIVISPNSDPQLRRYAYWVLNGVVDDESAADRELLEQVFANVVVSDSRDQDVIEGKRALAFGDFVSAGKAKNQGTQIDFTAEGLGTPNNIWSAVLETAPNPNAARLWQAFLFTETAQQKIAEGTYFLRNTEGDPLNAQYPQGHPAYEHLSLGELKPYADSLSESWASYYELAGE